MKIAIVTASSLPVPPVNGGAVENLIDIILKENEKNQKNLEFTIFSCKSDRALEVSKKYKKCNFIYVNTDSKLYKIKKWILYVINKKTKYYHGNAFIREIIKIISTSDINYDAILVENRPEYCIPLRKMYNGKIYLHLHNDLLNKETKYSKEIVESLDGVYTVSDYIKKRVETIDKNLYVKTIYNGIDTIRFDKSLYCDERESLRKEYGFNNDNIVLMFSGRLNKAKGIDKLLEAFINIPEELQAKLLIIGSSIYGRTHEDNFLINLKKMANQRKNDIVFTGYMDYENISKIHAISDIAIIPSIWEDPSPLTVYEALSSGLPIITTDSGGIPEIVTSQTALIIKRDTFLVENLTNGIIRLSSNLELRKEMSKSARERGALFSKERFYLNLIEDIKERISLKGE